MKIMSLLSLLLLTSISCWASANLAIFIDPMDILFFTLPPLLVYFFAALILFIFLYKSLSKTTQFPSLRTALGASLFHTFVECVGIPLGMTLLSPLQLIVKPSSITHIYMLTPLVMLFIAAFTTIVTIPFYSWLIPAINKKTRWAIIALVYALNPVNIGIGYQLQSFLRFTFNIR